MSDQWLVLPDGINGVTFEFDPGVIRVVKQSLVDWLCAFVRRDIAEWHELNSLFVSSAADRHQWPSRHVMGHAVDISRINGKRLSLYYPPDPAVRAIADALIAGAQICGPSFIGREIFGPGAGPHGFKRKLGRPWPGVRDHWDHIHFSEGDRESISGCPWDRQRVAV